MHMCIFFLRQETRFLSLYTSIGYSTNQLAKIFCQWTSWSALLVDKECLWVSPCCLVLCPSPYKPSFRCLYPLTQLSLQRDVSTNVKLNFNNDSQNIILNACTFILINTSLFRLKTLSTYTLNNTSQDIVQLMEEKKNEIFKFYKSI